jgi:hypothetical protein
LSQAEKDDYLAKVDEALAAVGGKRLVLIVCDSAYALENWNTFGLEIFPDQNALEKHAELLQQIGLSRYVETETTTASAQVLHDWLSVTLSE